MVAGATRNASDSDVISGVSAWELTARMSPRSSVQVLTDAIENIYSSTRLLAGPVPAAPWAMHLADKHGYFRWICFDLDSSRGNVRKDAQRLTRWLRQLQIPYLECLSGPTGGRHVWVSVDHIHGQHVNTIGILAKQLLPTLDTTPLSARGNGAVRPPLTPHRTTGYSRPLGDVDELVTMAPVDGSKLLQLEQLLSAEGAALPTVHLAGDIRGIVTDARGRRYLRGDRRDPSMRILTLLDGTNPEVVSMTDKSRLQITVLAGLARAHWRYGDVQKHLATSPAFEHSRTVPVAGGRIPRRGKDPRTVLFNDWNRAVEFVAMHPLSRAEDSDYNARVSPLVEAVEAAQARADAVPGFWGTSGTSRAARAHAGRPSWRSVFDAVCVYILRSTRPDPRVSIRQIADATGYSKSACEQALRDLSTGEDAWLQRVGEAEGVDAARYTLHPRLTHQRFATPSETLSTEPSEQKWALGGSYPPPGSQPQEATPRLQPLLRSLTARLVALNRDLFSAPRTLGRAAGRTLQHLSPTEPTTTQQISLHTRSNLGRTRTLLHKLHRAGVAVRHAAGWRAAADTVIDTVDRSIDQYGYLGRRRVTHQAEGVRWRWWLAEVNWRNLPRHEKRRRPTAAVGLIPQHTPSTPTDEKIVYPAYPKTPAGEDDHRGAMQFVLAGAIVDVRAAA